MRATTRRATVPTTAIIVWSLAVAIPARAASTIVVPTDQPTIQAAVSAATAGDTVLVQPGNYAESIRIAPGRDGLTIAAADQHAPPVVLGANGSRVPAVAIEGVDDVTLRSLVVQGGDEGIRVDHAYGAVLDDVHVQNAGIGILLRSGGRHSIVASEIAGTQVGEGIRVQHCPAVTIQNVVVDDTAREGILVRRSRHASIVGTTVSRAHSDHGIVVIGSSNTTLNGCTSRRNDGDGIRVRRSANLVLRQNDAQDNGGVGLRIDRCVPFASVRDVVAAGNQASANQFRDIIVTPPNCHANRCVTTTTRPAQPKPTTTTTSTSSTTFPFVTTTTPTTTPTPTTQPTVLPRWRLFVRIARQVAGDVDVNVPYRSTDAALVIPIPGLDLSAFRPGDQVTAAEIDAQGGDASARFESAAAAYIAAHPSDYPGFDHVLALKWVMRVPAL